MTRKEWIKKNLPSYVNDQPTNDGVICAPVKGCPGMFKDLVALDPSCNVSYFGQPSCKDNNITCTECWNTPISQQPNDEIPVPVLGGRFWTFVLLNISQNADLFVMGNFVITALIQDDTIIKVVAKDEILNQTCIFFYDPEKKCIRKLSSDGLLEQKYPEIDFTIYWDEESMNRARRGIISDHEYTNQYILLKKG